MERIEKLKLELKMYHFPLTLREVKRKWESDSDGSIKPRSAYNLELNRILDMIKNPRGTLLLLILSGESYVILQGGESLVRENGIHAQGSMGKLISLLRKGRWIVRKTGWYPSLSLTDCKSFKDAQEWARTLTEINEFSKNNYYYSTGSYKYNETITMIGLKRLLKQMKTSVTKKQKERVQRNSAEELAIKGIKVEELEDHTVVKFTDLTKHRWRLEFHPKKTIVPRQFSSLVYSHKTCNESQQLETLWSILEDYPNYRVTVNLDLQKEVEVEFTQRSGVPRKTLLNGKRVKTSNGIKILKAYFFGDGKLRLKWNEEEERLLKDGLAGTIRDKEGATSFILALEKKGSQWFLCSGRMRVHVKGGMGMIQSLETVLRGTSTKGNGGIEFLKRLSEIVGMDRAVKLLDSGKETGKILGSLKGQ